MVTASANLHGYASRAFSWTVVRWPIGESYAATRVPRKQAETISEKHVYEDTMTGVNTHVQELYTRGGEPLAAHERSS